MKFCTTREGKLVCHKLFPLASAVEGIKLVPSVCLSVSVSAFTDKPFDIRTKKFGRGMDLDYISDEFEGQGHRSKVKVVILKNTIFKISDGLASFCRFTLS